MSDFDPGEGWRRVSDDERIDSTVNAFLVLSEPGTYPLRRWVREEPVPPLPTEPYTTIEVSAPNGSSIHDDPVFTLRQTKAGLRWWNERGPHEVQWLVGRITGFKVLAEPKNEGLQRAFDILAENAVTVESARIEAARAITIDFERAGVLSHGSIFDEIAKKHGVIS